MCVTDTYTVVIEQMKQIAVRVYASVQEFDNYFRYQILLFINNVRHRVLIFAKMVSIVS